jgi:hypothetical protein
VVTAGSASPVCMPARMAMPVTVGAWLNGPVTAECLTLAIVWLDHRLTWMSTRTVGYGGELMWLPPLGAGGVGDWV